MNGLSYDLTERLKVAAKQLQDVLNECGEYVDAEIVSCVVSSMGGKDRAIFRVQITYREEIT